MLRQLTASIATAAILSLSFSVPSAHAETFEQCIEAAGKQYASDRKNGIDNITASAWWNAAVQECRRRFHR